MPCLHDEPYAWLRVVSTTLSSVGGVWFLSQPEHQLGHRVAPQIAPIHDVVGAAVEVPASYDPVGFKARRGIRRPFVLYAGRREEGKGWHEVLRAFGAAVERDEVPFDLVTVGVGEAHVPDELAERVIDLGYLSNDEMPDVFAAAAALVQPSANESFSRTVMEAWLAGTPVIATAHGEVVAWHCERSGGGLTYDDDADFANCLRTIAQSPKEAERLAESGRAYVLENYRWPVVLEKMEASLERVIAGDETR